MIPLIILAVCAVIGLQFLFKWFSSRQKTELANQYHLVRRTQHVLTGAMILVLMEILTYPVAQLAASMGALVTGGATLARIFNKTFNKIFMRHFKHLLRPHEEYGFPGAFYFISGVAICLCLFPKDVAALGILLVSVGDPSAAIIGITFPNSRKLWSNKNYAGTIGSSIVYTISALLYASVAENKILNIYGIFVSSVLLFAVGLAVELLPLGQQINKYLRLDDNIFGMIAGCLVFSRLI